MMDVAVIILTKDEELHIRRCLERLASLAPRQIFVVDCGSTDRTEAIAREFDAVTFVYHAWPGTQARQFNWALDNLPIKAEWVLRLDADEYVEEVERVEEVEKVEGVEGWRLELKRKFMGGEIRHGTAGIRQVRLFRLGKARYPETLMDERLQVDGVVKDMDLAFYDDNLHDLKWWKAKHLGYARREAEQAREGMRTGVWADPRKAAYYRLPRYFRAVLYFLVRYILKLGFLDGRAGFRWHFWQGLWYRWQVDGMLGPGGEDLV